MKELVLIEDLGMRYPKEQSKQRRRYGLYKCFCGNTFENQIDSIKRGLVSSCGCNRKLSELGGVDSKHKLYSVWSSMKQRCYNHNSHAYKDYGARGIKVCDRWLNFKNFIEDMYPSYRDDLSLDRIDVNGNYEPDNCRWANAHTQSCNRRLSVNNKSGYNGVSFHTKKGKFIANIQVHSKKIHIGTYQTALEAAKAYERYVRLNKLEHNFTPVLSEFEIMELETK